MVSLLLSLSLMLPAQADNPEPVAMVLTTQGAPLLERGSDTRRLGAMDLLQPGDKLRVPAGGSVKLVFLADDHKETLKPGTQVSLGVKGCTPADAVEREEETRLPPESRQNLRELRLSARGGVGVPRSLNGKPPQPAVTPLIGAAVLSDRPTLTWTAREGADGYLVQLLSGADEKEPRVHWQERTRETRLAYPTSQPPLTPGSLYRWKVYALKGDEKGEPFVASKFAVVTQRELPVLTGLQPLLKSNRPEDLLYAAVVYEGHHVYDEAFKLYERLAELSPHEPRFQQVLADYYDRAGRPDRAQAARAQARKLRAAQNPE